MRSEPIAPLVFFVYSDRHMHCDETRSLISIADSPVDLHEEITL